MTENYQVLKRMCEVYKLTPDELDYIFIECTDEEFDSLFITKSSTFCDKRQAIKVVQKYLEKMPKE